MVLDINYFRDEKLLKELKESEERRCEENSVVDQVVEADKDWKKAMFAYEQLKKSVNEVSKKISEFAKLNREKSGLAQEPEFLALKELADARKAGVADCLKKIDECSRKRDSLLKLVGNVVSSDLLSTKDESLNQVLRFWVPNNYSWEYFNYSNSFSTTNTTNTTNNNNNNTTSTNNNNNNMNMNNNNNMNMNLMNLINNYKNNEDEKDEGKYYYMKSLVENIKKPKWKLLKHDELLTKIGGLDMAKGVEVAGHRGYFLKGRGCMLNLALLNYGLNFLVSRGFLPVHTPYLMKREIMSQCAELDDFDQTLYSIPSSNNNNNNSNYNNNTNLLNNDNNNNNKQLLGEEEEDENKLYLIATSEQPLCALHKNETYQIKQLPLKYAGISTCFRREAGAHGKDLKGLFRVHQFQKVEQFIVCAPEESKKFHEEMIKFSEDFYRSLKLPFRVVSIVAGALNKAASKKYDLEAWFPGQDNFRELVSCSNCTDYQSRYLFT